MPAKAGDRVKTDRRDAEKLARSYRAGDLTAVWVPDAAHEALRDLVRAREAAKKDQLRARHRLGQVSAAPRPAPADRRCTAWTQRHLTWMNAGALRAARARGDAAGLPPRSRARGRSHRAARARDRRGGDRRRRRAMRAVIEALQALRGIALDLGGDDRRGSRRALPLCQAPQLMGYSGLVAQRGFERRADAARRHYENGQCASAARRHRSGLGVSAPPGGRARACANARPLSARRSKRSRGRRSTGCTPATAPLGRGKCQAAGGRRRSVASSWDSSGPSGSTWKRERDRRHRRSPPNGSADTTTNAATVAVEGHTERRILDRSMRRASGLEPALLVRGSSRRITIMRFRPANIRVINRRDQPPRPPSMLRSDLFEHYG